MINEAIDYIRNEIIHYLGVPNTEVFVDNIHILAKDNNSRGVYISLVNLQEEPTLKNTSHVLRKNNKIHYKKPPIFLNLYLLFAVNYSIYSTGLLHLSKIIELFQSKPMFDSSNEDPARPFPSSLGQLVLDFHDLDFEALNHLWGVLGGEYYPSALYKVRVVKIQRDVSVEGPEITTIQVDTNQL